MKSLIALVLLLWADTILATPSNPQGNYSRSVGKETWTYLTNDSLNDIVDLFDWCGRVSKGQLPSIHSREDLDFLADVVIKKRSSGHRVTWVGAVKKGETKYNVDKTPFDYDLPMYEKELSEQNCTKQECFLYMFNDEDHKTFFWYPMTLSGRGVCVIKSNEGESGTEPPGSGEDVDQRLREIDQKINSTSSIINDSITKLSNDYKTDIQKMDRRMSNIESKFQDFINVIDGIKKLLARIEKST